MGSSKDIGVRHHVIFLSFQRLDFKRFFTIISIIISINRKWLPGVELLPKSLLTLSKTF
jgi:hypothetical protein